MKNLNYTLANLEYKVDPGEPNLGYIMGPRHRAGGARWVAKIQHNGEFLEAQQTAMGMLYAAAPKLLTALVVLLDTRGSVAASRAEADAIVAAKAVVATLTGVK